MEKRVVATDVLLKNQVFMFKKEKSNTFDFKFLEWNIVNFHSLYSLRSFTTKNNTPPMPLYDAHLGGFLFL